MNSKRVFFKLSFLLLALMLPGVFCSSGYITPDSLTATAQPQLQTAIPTAYYLQATDSQAEQVTSTPENNAVVMLTEAPLAEETPVATVTQTATLAPISANTPPMLYYAQSGDTIDTLASRFGVNPFEIVSSEPIPEFGFINPKQMMMIPVRLVHTSSDSILIPDSEVVYSSSASSFNTESYVKAFGGKLNNYTEYLSDVGSLNGAQIIQRLATENSINPRILLGLLQYQSNWVFGEPTTLSQSDYPMAYINSLQKGLLNQTSWAIDQLSIGYYYWREGKLTHLSFKSGETIRLAPNLNAGTVAIMYFFSQTLSYDKWLEVTNPLGGFTLFYSDMFGDPIGRASQAEPLLPSNLIQPDFTLPFYEGQTWSYTGGPHGAWRQFGSLAAIDFAPNSDAPGCVRSENWVVAGAPGVISRLGTGVVVLDLDGDGDETTGWNILYLHLANTKHLAVGQWVDQGAFLGNPSCEGGHSTGTHLHIARKYNGEWISAGSALPFNLGGWEVQFGNVEYEGYLLRDGVRIKSCVCGAAYTQIAQDETGP